MNNREEIVNRMNYLGKQGEPFIFLIDFLGHKPRIFPLEEMSGEILWQTPGFTNVNGLQDQNPIKIWKTKPVSFEKYEIGFNQIKKHINKGDTYLLNYTQPTLIETNLSLEEIFYSSSAPYKIYLKNRFVCFSPEPFVKIEDGKILAFPMKGTIDAGIGDAKELILKDTKEVAEHNTIVDLIRNDLSLIAENIVVEKFRYLSHIKTNQKNLWQVSSQISGNLPKNFPTKIGNIIFAMLPAGSISGAPKKKTLEIIEKTEKYDRGYYTGIFGIFDGKNLDSCVLIRFIENLNGQLIYKSGGGITFMSEASREYNEMLEKVYVPIA